MKSDRDYNSFRIYRIIASICEYLYVPSSRRAIIDLRKINEADRSGQRFRAKRIKNSSEISNHFFLFD